MKTIKGSDIDAGLENLNRVYLCGNLKRPQEYPVALPSLGVEIGINRYVKFSIEKTHYHERNYEYNYIISGELKIKILDEDKEYHLSKGDMFLIEPGMKNTTKALPDTEVVFVKAPGGDDKVLIEENEDIKKWQNTWGEEKTKSEQFNTLF